MRIVAFALVLLASACAGTPDTTPVNTRLIAAPAEPVAELGVDGDAIALAFSGGGARSASFSLGALLQLRDMKGTDGGRLIDRVALVTAVSGGAITAAYFGRHGADELDGFRAAALDKDWQGKLHTSFASPNNWARLLQGGLNGPELLANWLDREVFGGAKMRDLPNRPRIVINATDLYTGAPFAFAAPYFQAVCSNLGDVRVADAVAANGTNGVGSVTFNSSIDPATGEWVTQTLDLSTNVVVGDFFGAQMSGFDVAPNLGLIDHLQDGQINVPYPDRTVVIAGAAAWLLCGLVAIDLVQFVVGLTFGDSRVELSGADDLSGRFHHLPHRQHSAASEEGSTQES
jgi:hypothetical protein